MLFIFIFVELNCDDLQLTGYYFLLTVFNIISEILFVVFYSNYKIPQQRKYQ